MKLYDHTEPNFKKQYPHINGAVTYSKDIVKFHLPAWKKILGVNDVISTCPRLGTVRRLPMKADTIVQYLHQYPYTDPIKYVSDIKQLIRSRMKFNKIWFITSYRSYFLLLNKHGYNAIHIPMYIDYGAIEPFAGQEKTITDRVLWFGNLYPHKDTTYKALTEAVRVDTISKGLFNKKDKILQREAWELAGKYKFAAGVGRCALELYALGCKVLIAGQKFGGIVTTEEEWKLQLATNINGRIVTTDRDIRTCYALLGDSLTDLKAEVTPSIIQSKIKSEYKKQ